jgi:hypothetical protein
MFNKENYVITSGWWCGKVEGEIRKIQGSDAIRQVTFFIEWKNAVKRCCKPKKIMVLDSASPTRPNSDELSDVEFISIDKNPGHSTDHTGQYSGYMRSIMMGIAYAEACDADYWVYVEQDALLKGEGIIEYCISKMTTPYMFGSGHGTPQMLQQSLCIIRKDGYAPFLKRLRNIELKDKELAPEIKFILASSRILSVLPASLFQHLNDQNFVGRCLQRIVRWSSKKGLSYDHLPIGYGRTRPINFDEQYYYFQHGTEEELAKHF